VGVSLNVSSTFVVFNGTDVPGNFLAGAGSEPITVAYDPAKSAVYTTNFETNSVSIATYHSNLVSYEVNATVDVGTLPTGIVYDPAHGEVYVANWESGSVSVINDTNNSVVATVDVGGQPMGLAYDSHTGQIFVSNWETDAVDIINDTNHTEVGTPIAVGSSPDAIIFDSGTDQIFVAATYLPSPYTSMPVSVIDDANDSVVATVHVGDDPGAMTYDPDDDEVWVANTMSNNVSIIDDDGDTVVRSLPVGADPDGLAYDSVQGEVYVANGDDNNLTILNAEDRLSVGSVGVGADPAGETFADGLDQVVVANGFSDNLSMVDGATPYVDYTVWLTASPTGIAYDSNLGELFVTNYAANGTVSVINDTRNQLVARIPVGSFPIEAVFDPYQDLVFVSNSRSSSVSVISDATNTVVANVTVGTNPWGLAYDSVDQEVFVANVGSGSVSVISDSSRSVVATVELGSTTDPEFCAYDTSTAIVYVTEYGANKVALIDPTLNSLFATAPTGSGPNAVVYDSVDAEVFVSNAVSSNVTAYTEGTYPALPVVAANITVGDFPSGLAYDPTDDLVLVADAFSDNLGAISPATFSVVATATVGDDPQGSAFDEGQDEFAVGNLEQGTLSLIAPMTGSTTIQATFTESGLPNGATWYVNVTGTAPLSGIVSGGRGTVLSLDVTNGSYNFIAATDWSNWTTTHVGIFNVSGTNVRIAVPFTEVTYAYAVQEWGLPAGGIWYVNFSNGESVSTHGGNGVQLGATLELDNGTYTYTTASNWKNYTTLNATGQFTVEGEPGTIGVFFSAAPNYSVTFTERGLPSGATWYVNVPSESALSGTVSAGTGTSAALLFVNGTYNYSATTNWLNWSTVRFGSFEVMGADLQVNLTFNPVEYEVIFTETGLAGGTAWTVDVGTVPYPATAPGSVTLSEMNGTFSYNVPAVTGYNVSAPSSSFTVFGHTVSVTIDFTKPSPPTGSGTTGTRDVDWGLFVVGGIIALVALLLLVVAWRRRKRTPDENANATTPNRGSPGSP
jgi:YVTN family beta-propeller protein